MLYLLYVLTFLAGILFYLMTPRDDQVNLDAYRAEGFIVSFLSQHQAAKDYMTQWLGFDLKHDPRASVPSFSLKDQSSPNNRFAHFFPNSMNPWADMSDRQGDAANGIAMGPDNDGNYRFLTSVFCLTDSDNLTNCGSDTTRKAYLTTYSGSTQRPSWWPPEQSNRQRRYGSWRTSITRRTNGSYNCGVLVQTVVPIAGGSINQWCVDNGQTVKFSNGKCAQQVPDAIINALCPGNTTECEDALLCISRVKTGPDRYYVGEGLSAFYDAINNQKTGAEGDRSDGSIPWEDLMRDNQQAGTTINTGTPPVADFSAFGDVAASSGVIFPNLDIISQVGTGYTIFHDFTFTVLLKGPGIGDLDLLLELVDNTNPTGAPWNISLVLKKQTNGDPSVYFSDDGGISQISPPPPPTVSLQNLDPNSRIMSLTVIGNENELKAYINAYKEPVATLDKTAITTAHPEYFTTGVTQHTKHLRISSNSDSAHIYGVRFYSRPLSVERVKTAGGFTPSELEQNFKMDSKRYGIGVHPDYNPSPSTH